MSKGKFLEYTRSPSDTQELTNPPCQEGHQSVCGALPGVRLLNKRLISILSVQLSKPEIWCSLPAYKLNESTEQNTADCARI